MSKRRNTVSNPTEENPIMETQEYVDRISALAQGQPGSGYPSASNEAVKTRKRRSPLELFASQKDERALAVADARVALTRAEDDLQSAIDAEIDFVEKARAALGL